MPLLHRGNPSGFTTGPWGGKIRTSRPQTQMREKFLVFQLCLFGLSNTQARRHSVRSKISGTAAWWLMQLNESWSWHGTTITNPIVSNFCQTDCSTLWTRSQVHILNHCRPSSWKNDMVLVWVEGSCHFLGQSIPLSAFILSWFLLSWASGI